MSAAVINLQQKFSLFKDTWSPKIVAELNGSEIKLVKLEGEFIWHKHDNADEMFIVVNGNLKIELRDKILELKPGELVVIPKGVEHKPIAENDVQIILIEPKGTLNTGDAADTGDKKATEGEWI